MNAVLKKFFRKKQFFLDNLGLFWYNWLVPVEGEKNLILEALKMKVFKEVETVYDFNFWSGAKDTVKYLDNAEIEAIFNFLDLEYPEGMSETELNDFFWFEDDFIANLLGYDSFEDIMNRED